VTAQPFDPVGFYRVALAIFAGTPEESDEAYLRTVISRAYYACFHLARLGCARKWSWRPPETGQHRAVIRKLREHRQLYAARQLDALLSLRERADYDLNATIDRLVCHQALDLAGWLVPRLRSL
jgi:hypothetical protein